MSLKRILTALPLFGLGLWLMIPATIGWSQTQSYNQELSQTLNMLDQESAKAQSRSKPSVARVELKFIPAEESLASKVRLQFIPEGMRLPKVEQKVEVTEKKTDQPVPAVVSSPVPTAKPAASVNKPPEATPIPASPPANPIWMTVGKLIDAPVVVSGRDRDNTISVPNISPQENLKKNGVYFGSVGFFNESKPPGTGDGVYVAHYATIGDRYGHAFYLLPQVSKNDQIVITNERGEKFTYKVIVKDQLPRESNLLTVSYNNPKKFVEEEFKDSRGEKVAVNDELIVLITCIGNYDSSEGQFLDRLVVVARRI